MRAAVLPQIPSMLEVSEIQVDRPGRREVLVRTVAAGLCHSDLHFMEGKYAHDTPTVPGHEAAGVVEAVGEDVTHVQLGDHVIGCVSIFCGHCEYCLSGRPVYPVREMSTSTPAMVPLVTRKYLRVSMFACATARSSRADVGPCSASA